MLDYAANCTAYGEASELRSLFESDRKDDAERALAELIQPDTDTDAYWLRVKTNLEAGRIRLLFVADVIPPELRRVVEFLNVQMTPAEVLAVELRLYVKKDLTTIVPTIYGQTEKTKRLPTRSPSASVKSAGIAQTCFSSYGSDPDLGTLHFAPIFNGIVDFGVPPLGRQGCEDACKHTEPAPTYEALYSVLCGP